MNQVKNCLPEKEKNEKFEFVWLEISSENELHASTSYTESSNCRKPAKLLLKLDYSNLSRQAPHFLQILELYFRASTIGPLKPSQTSGRTAQTLSGTKNATQSDLSKVAQTSELFGTPQTKPICEAELGLPGDARTRPPRRTGPPRPHIYPVSTRTPDQALAIFATPLHF